MFKKIFFVVLSIAPSSLRVTLYRILFGAKIGRGVKIGWGTVILADKISIGDYTSIGNWCKIKVQELDFGQRVSIGNSVRISVFEIKLESRVILSSKVDIVGDSEDARSKISLGMHSWIFDYCYINVAREVTFGRNVGIGGGSYLFTHGVWLPKLDGFPVSFAPVEIKDNVWLPWGCFVMPGVTISENVVVGARSLINKDVPPNALIAGTPAKILKTEVRKSVSIEEKEKMISELTFDFGVCNKYLIEEREGRGELLFLCNQYPLITLHRQQNSGAIEVERLSQSTLHIFLCEIPDTFFRKRPCLSLANYLSSSEDAFSPMMKKWLSHGRTIGLRYYPTNEIGLSRNTQI